MLLHLCRREEQLPQELNDEATEGCGKTIHYSSHDMEPAPWVICSLISAASYMLMC